MIRRFTCGAIAVLSMFGLACGRTELISPVRPAPASIQPEQPTLEERCGFVPAGEVPPDASGGVLLAAEGRDLLILAEGGNHRRVHRVHVGAAWVEQAQIEQVQGRGEWVLVQSVAFGPQRYEFETSLVNLDGTVAWTRHDGEYSPMMHLSADGTVARHAAYAGEWIRTDGSSNPLGPYLPLARATADGWVPVERRSRSGSEGFSWLHAETGKLTPFALAPKALDAWTWSLPRFGERLVYLAEDDGLAVIVAERPGDVRRIPLGPAAHFPYSEVLAANDRGFALVGERWSNEGRFFRVDLERAQIAEVNQSPPEGWARDPATFRQRQLSLLEDGTVAEPFARDGQTAVFVSDPPSPAWRGLSSAIDVPEQFEWFGRDTQVSSRGGSAAIVTVDQLGYLSQLTAVQVARGATVRAIPSPPRFDRVSLPNPVELSADGLCAAAWTEQASELRLIVLDVVSGETAIAWGRPWSAENPLFHGAPLVATWSRAR